MHAVGSRWIEVIQRRLAWPWMTHTWNSMHVVPKQWLKESEVKTDVQCSARFSQIWLYIDSSGARGILQRRGVGRLRHLSCRIIWLQALVETGTVKLSSMAGSMNPADVGTKRLPAPRMRCLMSTLGMYNVQTGSLEGADDPAGIFKKKGNVVGQIAAILKTLAPVRLTATTTMVICHPTWWCFL